MAQETALVDDVRDVARGIRPEKGKQAGAGGEAIRIRFAGGVDARLDPASPRDRVWAEVLESMRDSQEPAYVEIDPDTRYITSLLVPQRFTVKAIRESGHGNGLEIDLEISHARHYLRRGHPRFKDMEQTLERALRDGTPVLITESLDSSAIIDVRPMRSSAKRQRRRQ
jgi:hypothetical protein